MTKKDNLDSYLRLFAKEEAFFFKIPAHERPTTSINEAIQFRPRRRFNHTPLETPRVVRGRYWKRVVI